MKYEWRKHDKELYIPKTKAQFLEIPRMSYLVIEGEGSPDSDGFTECITALYSMSYGIKMNKGGEDYYDYTVFPLEGIWSFNEKGIELFKQGMKASDLKSYMSYKLMIRQPDFLTRELVEKTKATILSKKNASSRLDEVRYETIEEGKSVQILHLGPYAKEDESFDLIEAYCKEKGLIRKSKLHKEIYLSDARKVTPEKLKTTLRVWVE